MRSLGRFPLVFWAAFQQIANVDLLDDQDFVLEVDLAFAL